MSGKQYRILTVTGLVLVAMISIYAIVQVRNQDRDYAALFGRYTKIFAPEVPAAASFAGERVPLDLYYVREAFDREIMAGTFMHSSTVLMFKRAYRWFPVIEPILKKNGIPDDFKFVALAESNLINITSPAGAEGYWQFMKATGVKHGLEINEFVDERYHMEQATRAACDYFREAYSKFGSWTLAAASYNRGIDGLGKALDRQKVNKYFELYLNDETSRYVFRILAMKEIYNHPVRYGFYLRERDLYPPVPTKPVVIDSAISDLPAFARKFSVSYRLLRELNPWIQHYSLPNKSKKSYTFQLPKEDGLSYESLLKKIPPRDTYFNDTLKFKEVN